MAIDRDKVLQAAQKFVEKKKYDKAVLEYQKLVAEDPNDARTLLKIGDLQSKMEAYPDAIGTYERVGKFYASQGFALKAIAVYKQIRELIAKHAPQLEERYGHITPKLAELYQQLGLTSDALAALDEVATRLQRQNKDQEAIDVFRKIVELDPTNPLPHLRLAEALSRVKDNEAAIAEFGLAATQLVRLGRRDDALKVIERLLHHRPDPVHARIAAELYLARNQQNDGMQALSKLQICFQANPKDLDTLALLARAFAAIGQAAKGIEVQKEMAKIAREQGKTELFKQLVEKLQRSAPNDEGVKQLIATARGDAQPAPPPPPRPPQPSYPDEHPAPQSVPIDDLDYEAVETGDIEEAALEAEPIPLRSDRPPPRQMPREPARYDASPGESNRARERESSAPELMIVGDDGVAEELPSGESQQADVGEQLAQVLSDAASFRRVRLYPKAIETLRIGLEIEPRSLDVREMLRDVLLEAGQVEQAVLEMLDLATLYVDSLDGETAARCLQDVLAYDPPNQRARAMLYELGYEVIDEPQEPVQDYAPSDPQMVAAPLPPRGAAEKQAYASEAPLPSYELEEVGPADVAPPPPPPTPIDPSARPRARRRSIVRRRRKHAETWATSTTRSAPANRCRASRSRGGPRAPRRSTSWSAIASPRGTSRSAMPRRATRRRTGKPSGAARSRRPTSRRRPRRRRRAPRPVRSSKRRSRRRSSSSPAGSSRTRRTSSASSSSDSRRTRSCASGSPS